MDDPNTYIAGGLGPEPLTLTSIIYPDCIFGETGRGPDYELYRLENYYADYGDFRLYFDMWYSRETIDPVYTWVFWGPSDRYSLEILSSESGWDCVNEALDVLSASAERGFSE